MLKRSDKRSDPFKIGKFGIGFNSVFHVTGNEACTKPCFFINYYYASTHNKFVVSLHLYQNHLQKNYCKTPHCNHLAVR